LPWQPPRTVARQLQVFVRLIPTAETVAKINPVTIADVCGATRIFRAAATPATLGPVEHVPGLAEVTERLAA
jgi:hypothetical protein